MAVTSGRALCTSLWMRKPAALGGRVRLPPTTLPSRLTAIMSEALRRPKCTPRAASGLNLAWDPQELGATEPTIRPEHIMGLRVSDADVARNTFHVAFASPVPECSGHVFELPLAFGGHVGAEVGHAGEHHVAVGDGGEGGLVFHAVDVLGFILGGDGLGDHGDGGEEVADRGGSHSRGRVKSRRLVFKDRRGSI